LPYLPRDDKTCAEGDEKHECIIVEHRYSIVVGSGSGVEIQNIMDDVVTLIVTVLCPRSVIEASLLSFETALQTLRTRPSLLALIRGQTRSLCEGG
jgi:hypothetical protein